MNGDQAQRLTDMIQSKLCQLEAEIWSVAPGEGSPGASLTTQCGVHAATITAHAKQTLALFLLLTIFIKARILIRFLLVNKIGY